MSPVAWCPGSRGDHGGVGGGFVLGRTPPERTACGKEACGNTAPEPPFGYRTPTHVPTNSLLPPIDTTGCYEQYPRSVGRIIKFLLLKEKIGLEGVTHAR